MWNTYGRHFSRLRMLWNWNKRYVCLAAHRNAISTHLCRRCIWVVCWMVIVPTVFVHVMLRLAIASLCHAKPLQWLSISIAFSAFYHIYWSALWLLLCSSSLWLLYFWIIYFVWMQFAFMALCLYYRQILYLNLNKGKLPRCAEFVSLHGNSAVAARDFMAFDNAWLCWLLHLIASTFISCRNNTTKQYRFHAFSLVTCNNQTQTNNIFTMKIVTFFVNKNNKTINYQNNIIEISL